jgi:hypothetical protein
MMVTLDRDAATTIFRRSDGMEARFPLGGGFFRDTSALRRIHFLPTGEGLAVETTGGDSILFEMPRFDRADQLHGRLIVYLDQNQWSLVANARQGNDRVHEADVAAAERIQELVAENKIVLPASSGHFYETTRWSDPDRRYVLGLTILQLSRGWQMRNPIDVRRAEILEALQVRFSRYGALPCPSAITLLPNVISSGSGAFEPYRAPADFAPEAAFTTEALVSACSQIDVMLDSERIDPPEEEPRWARVSQEISCELHSRGLDRQQQRKYLDSVLLSDLKEDIETGFATVGLLASARERWLRNEAMATVRGLRSLAVYRELHHDRHMNTGTIWRTNELTDMVFLSCAAGYCDFIVCERHMAGLLRQGLGRLGRSMNLYRRLRDAVPAIEEAVNSVHDTGQ